MVGVLQAAAGAALELSVESDHVGFNMATPLVHFRKGRSLDWGQAQIQVSVDSAHSYSGVYHGGERFGVSSLLLAVWLARLLT